MQLGICVGHGGNFLGVAQNVPNGTYSNYRLSYPRDVPMGHPVSRSESSIVADIVLSNISRHVLISKGDLTGKKR